MQEFVNDYVVVKFLIQSEEIGAELKTARS